MPSQVNSVERAAVQLLQRDGGGDGASGLEALRRPVHELLLAHRHLQLLLQLEDDGVTYSTHSKMRRERTGKGIFFLIATNLCIRAI